MIWERKTNKFCISGPENQCNEYAPNERQEYVLCVLTLIEAVFV
jgi:hypothetical protein